MRHEFGGILLYKKRKNERPLSFQNSTHLVLRLKDGLPALFDPHDKKLRGHIYRLARKYHIRVYHLIFNHTHVHANLLLPDRKYYVQFIREMTAFLVTYFTSSLNIPGVVFRKIFSHRPYTRIVAWGRAYRVLKNYMKKNERESGVKQMELDMPRNRNSTQINHAALQMFFVGLKPPS